MSSLDKEKGKVRACDRLGKVNSIFRQKLASLTQLKKIKKFKHLGN